MMMMRRRRRRRRRRSGNRSGRNLANGRVRGEI
jgi:hypothetical protein